MSYVRDKRSPRPKNEKVSRVMSANKAKNTKPELSLRKALWSEGLRGYRLHNRSLPGRPDIAFTKNKVAVFVHGCYWHRCPFCNYPLPKHNRAFWKEKFKKNAARDEKKKNDLRAVGWSVITVWECELKDVRESKKALRKIRARTHPHAAVTLHRR